MNIIGIHQGHNASASLLQDGQLTHAAQEERFTGVKNQPGFPGHAIRWILSNSGLTPRDIDHVVHGSWNKTLDLSRDEILEVYRGQAQRSKRVEGMTQLKVARATILKKVGLYEKLKLALDDGLFEETRALFAGQTDRISSRDHHLCHAAQAYYMSPFAEGDALVLTADGSGDGLSASVCVGRGGRLERISETSDGHSLGDIYARVTFMMGMVPLEHEYKLMGMAPYVSDRYAEKVCRIFESYLEIDGLDFKRKIPEPTQYIGKRLAQDLQYVRFDSVAAGLQLFTERLMARWVRNAIQHTGIRRLACSGGTFMNVKANGVIGAFDEVDEIFVAPSCGDESLSMGAAYLTCAEEGGTPRPPEALYLGPDLVQEDLRDAVGAADFFEVEEPEDAAARVAELLANGEIVARCCGRTEFGARALGNRSLLADPSQPHIVRILNQMIKMRDFWMPFAPIVMRDRQEGYFINPKGIRSPYMMMAFDTVEERFEDMAAALQPADRSSRPEILERGQNPEMERVLDLFEERTGRPVLLNTSYNIHGEPMVSGVEQAIDVFRRSGLNWLWLDRYVLHKIA
jgi:carbamoyltransferase